MNTFVTRFDIDRLLQWLSLAAGLLLLCSMLAMSVSIMNISLPSLEQLGLHFVMSTEWNPAQDEFGAMAIIVGTLVTTLLALILAVPLSLLTAVSLAHLLPKPLANGLSMAIEVMAAIPSIIYGMWGLFVLAPFLSVYCYPYLLTATEQVPVLNQSVCWFADWYEYFDRRYRPGHHDLSFDNSDDAGCVCFGT